MNLWDRGVLDNSSWHALEEIGVFTDGESAILHGETSGAWPTQVERVPLYTKNGLEAPDAGILASYAQHPQRVLGVVGQRYRATTPEEWRNLIKAAAIAGAKPTGAFSLRGGSRVLGTFEVGTSNGLRTQLLLVDSFDGSYALSSGFTSIRVVCANTLTAAFRKDGSGMARLRHTASLEQNVEALRHSIGEAIKSGEAVRQQYERAKGTKLDREQARNVFDALFPPSVLPDGRAKTIAEKVRAEAEAAAAMAINNEGSTLATVWNAATYLVDRTGDGQHRKGRGKGDTLDSLLFGSRAQRLHEIHQTIEVVLKDGTVEPMTVSEAREHGMDDPQIGRSILDDMLN